MAMEHKQTKLDETQVKAALARCPEWRREGDAITRTAKFADFKAAKAFVDRVADAANEADHHPDIHLENYNEVRLVLSTHTVGGLSANDFALAERFDELVTRAAAG